MDANILDYDEDTSALGDRVYCMLEGEEGPIPGGSIPLDFSTRQWERQVLI
jgi:hypothetical protein